MHDDPRNKNGKGQQDNAPDEQAGDMERAQQEAAQERKNERGYQ